MKHFLPLVVLLLGPVMINAQTATPAEAPAFTDALLDNLVGDWHVARKYGDGRTAENTLHVEWVLNHQFLELHYRDSATPPKYEAMVFIGFDGKAQRYVIHWIDVFGGAASKTIGTGTLDETAHTIYFQFNYLDSQFINGFGFDPPSKTWTSVMRQKSKGPWTLFAQDKITKR